MTGCPGCEGKMKIGVAYDAIVMVAAATWRDSEHGGAFLRVEGLLTEQVNSACREREVATDYKWQPLGGYQT